MDPRLSQFQSGWALIEALPLSVYVKDRGSCFLYVNRASARSLGLNEAAEAVGKTDLDFFESESALNWFELEQKMMTSGEPIIDHVAREVHLNGQDPAHWVLSCKYPFRDSEGRVAGLIGISKQIDKEHDELTRNTLAVRGAQVGLWHARRSPDGSVEVWFSRRWKELLGYREEEIPNRSSEFVDRVHPEDYSKVIEARNRYLAHPAAEGHYECEFRMKHKNGSWIWIRSYGEAEFSSDGTICLAFVGSHTDITASKDERELHEEILSMLPALVFMKDEQKRFRFVNPELARYYGTTKEEMERRREKDSYYNPNKVQTDHFDRDDQRVLDNSDPEIRRNGLVIDAEDIINNTTNEIRQLKTTKRLFMYPSRDPKKHVLGISTDITEALKKTKDERASQVDAHFQLRRLLAPLSSVQDLLDFRTKLPDTFKGLNLQYTCFASGLLSNARPGENGEHVIQAYATQWKSSFLNLRLTRVQGEIRNGVITLAEDPLLREFTSNPPAEPRTQTVSQLVRTPLGGFINSLLPKATSSNWTVILAAGVFPGAGPKQLSDLVTFAVLPSETNAAYGERLRSLLYFIQRFAESLAQFYRNSELYTERKEFLTDVTHQLITPLVNTIDICTSTVDKVQRMQVEQITDRFFEVRGLARHCAMFTRSFLAASQSDQAELVTRGDLNETSVKLTRLMIEVGKDFRVSAQTKGLRIVIEEDVLDAIGFQEIDEEWVRHALMNVVDNAVKYTASRSDGIVCLFGETANNRFALCVRNPSSIPIRPEYKDRIFDRWFRSPDAEREEVQGTGIGLALAKAVVLAHGGHIEVDQSEIRNGVYDTTFRLWFSSSRRLS